jgi:hypothetical protein
MREERVALMIRTQINQWINDGNEKRKGEVLRVCGARILMA